MIGRKNIVANLLVIFFALSCNKDDEQVNLLIGVWIGTMATLVSYEDGVQTDMLSTDFTDAVLTINADNTYTIMSDNEDDSGTWSQPTPDRLVITSQDGNSDSQAIITLTESTLVTERTEEETILGVVHRDVTTFNFRRQ